MDQETIFDAFLDSEQGDIVFDSVQTAIKKAFLAGYEQGKEEQLPPSYEQ